MPWRSMTNSKPNRPSERQRFIETWAPALRQAGPTKLSWSQLSQASTICPSTNRWMLMPFTLTRLFAGAIPRKRSSVRSNAIRPSGYDCVILLNRVHGYQT